MGMPDQADTPAPAGDAEGAEATATEAAYVIDAGAYQLELEAGRVLADMMSASAADDANVGELHAALVAAPDAAADHLDISAQHLTHSVDLFDVPTFHGDDAS